jgi:NADH-quinone oxidoreductase subunit E
MIDLNSKTKVSSILTRHLPAREEVISLMQDVQDALGYVPPTVIDQIAAHTGVSANEIFGIATFFKQFRFEQPGRHKVSVCLGTACHIRGATKILKNIEERLGIRSGGTTKDSRFSVESVRCLGACAVAPLVRIDDDFHGLLVTDDTERILKRYE